MVQLNGLRACLKNSQGAVAAEVTRRVVSRAGQEIRLLTRLCENSEMAFWKNEKGVLGPLAAKENAPYRNCGGRFSRVAGWRGVFAQSVTSAATIFRTRSDFPFHAWRIPILLSTASIAPAVWAERSSENIWGDWAIRARLASRCR